MGDECIFYSEVLFIDGLWCIYGLSTRGNHLFVPINVQIVI